MLPFNGTYISGLTSLSGTNHFFVGGISGATSNNRIFSIELYDAQTGLPVSVTDTWKNSVIGNAIKTHDGVFRVASGTGYTGLTGAGTGANAFLKSLPDNINWYWDPIYGVIGATGQTWAWSVCSGYQNTGNSGSTGITKYSQWSVEDYFNT